MNGYTARLMAAYSSGLLQPGEVSVASVEHDVGCAALSGRNCHCTPVVTVTTSRGVIHVDPDGSTRLEAKQ